MKRPFSKLAPGPGRFEASFKLKGKRRWTIPNFIRKSSNTLAIALLKCPQRTTWLAKLFLLRVPRLGSESAIEENHSPAFLLPCVPLMERGWKAFVWSSLVPSRVTLVHLFIFSRTVKTKIVWVFIRARKCNHPHISYFSWFDQQRYNYWYLLCKNCHSSAMVKNH